MTKVVLITGCSTGIGRGLAQRLTQVGDTVLQLRDFVWETAIRQLFRV
jgi:NAD(P)-dependent dehydrogenase (short-subunit alcohol dehydrogenase family)